MFKEFYTRFYFFVKFIFCKIYFFVKFIFNTKNKISKVIS